MKLKIGRLQYFCMIPNLLYGKAIGITSGVFVRIIGADTWTSMLIGFIIGILVVTVMAFLGSRFPEKTMIQYSEDLLGKWIGKGIGLLLALFFIVAFALSADVMVIHLSEYFLLDTPLLIICLLYVLLCMFGAWLGFEVVARISLIGFLMLIILNITMFLGVIKDFQFINLQPLFQNGLLANVSNSVYIFGDLAMAVFAVGILFPTINVKKKAVSISFWAMVVSTVLIVAWPFLETGVMGPDIMKKYIVVCMEQIRCAQFTKYFPRYELLMVGFFIFSVYVQSTAMLHCAKYCIKQITGIKRDLYILVPLTTVSIFLTYYLIKDSNNYTNFLSYPWPQICAVLVIGLPSILLFIALIKGKLKRAN
jgi:spore germination protein KB